MTKKKVKEISIIFLLSVLIFLSKWMPIYFLDFDFLPKLINFSTDIQYFPTIKSFSLLQFKNGFSYNEVPEKITTFPFASIIWHAMLYNFFSNFTFLILEFLFKFIQILTLYLIFNKIYENSKIALIATLFLFIFLFSLNLLIHFSEIKYFIILQNLFDGFFGLRFPRPIVTSVYFFLFIYFIILLDQKFYQEFNYKNLIYIALILSLLINSFFYFFVSCSILTIIIFKNKIKYVIINEKKKLLFFFFLIVIGSFPFIFQAIYGEQDFSLRQGLINITFHQKIYLIKYLLKSFLRIEVAMILLINILIFKFYKQNTLLKIFFFFYLSNIFSTFIFILFSPKIISLYQFIDLIILSGFFYLSLVVLDLLIMNLLNNKKNYKKMLIYNISFFIIVFFIYFDTKLEINLKIKKLIELDKINKLFVKNKFINTKKILLTNDIDISAMWILNENKYMSLSNGFHNSFKDIIIEKQLFRTLKNINMNVKDFEQILNFRSNFDKRNFLISFLFMNKYQANSLHTFSSYDNYDIDEIFEIKRTSPFRVQNQIIPKNEKQRLINQYADFKSEINEKPYLIILNKRDVISKIIIKKKIEYQMILNDEFYMTLIKYN